MESIFNKKSLERIKNIRTIFLKIFVGILIAEVIMWAFIILMQQSNEIVARFQATFLVVAAALFVCILDFRCIEKGKKLAQVLALVSLVTCGIWTLMQLLVAWNVLQMYTATGLFGLGSELTVVGRIISIVSATMSAAMFAALVSKIDENGGPIKPLKITAIVCMAYLWGYSVAVSLMDIKNNDFGTASALAGLAVLAFFVTWIAAAVISRMNRKDKIDHTVASPEGAKQNKEMQEEIKAMIEKEVQARLAEERSKEENKSSEE